MKAPRKSTNAEIDRRVRVVAGWIGAGAGRVEVHNLARQSWGGSWKTSDRYVGRARAKLLESAGRSMAEERATAIQFYSNVIKSDAPYRIRILARCRLDEIFGIDPPKPRSYVNGAVTRPAVITEPLNEAEAVATAKDLMAQYGLGKPRKLCGSRADGRGPSKGRGKSRT